MCTEARKPEDWPTSCHAWQPLRTGSTTTVLTGACSSREGPHPQWREGGASAVLTTSSPPCQAMTARPDGLLPSVLARRWSGQPRGPARSLGLGQWPCMSLGYSDGSESPGLRVGQVSLGITESLLQKGGLVWCRGTDWQGQESERHAFLPSFCVGLIRMPDVLSPPGGPQAGPPVGHAFREGCGAGDREQTAQTPLRAKNWPGPPYSTHHIHHSAGLWTSRDQEVGLRLWCVRGLWPG